MSSRTKPAIRLSAPFFSVLLVVLVALVLLVGKRLDMPFAGGSGAGPQHAATLVATENTIGGEGTSAPQTLARGETVATDGVTFARYTLNNTCTVTLAENSSLTLVDGRASFNTFNLLTGRAVATGDCTFVTRETTVHVQGSATLVHFSWLNELVILAMSDTTLVTQGATVTTLTPETGAVRFFTLQSAMHTEPATLSLTENELITRFYSWSTSL